MKIVQPKDWYLWRSSGVGSSDASVIVGVNPYQDYDSLLYAKALRVKILKTGDVIRHGKVLEDHIRSFLNDKYGWNLTPLFCVHDKYDFILASLDGIDTEKRVLVEIKAPITPYNGIPIYYLAQVYHQMLVTGYEQAIFVVYCRNNLSMINIERNEKAIQYILEKEIEFWRKVIELRKKIGVCVEEEGLQQATRTNAV